MFKKKITIILFLITLLFSFSSCSKEEFMNKVSGKGNTIKKDTIETTYDDTIDENQHGYYRFDKNKDNFHKLGEEIILKMNQNDFSVKINDVKIYNSPAEAEIKDVDLPDIFEFHPNLDINSTVSIRTDKIKEAQIILCDMDIKQISDVDVSINRLVLVYAKDNACTKIALGDIYESNTKIIDGKRELNIIPGETINTKVAWVIDPDILGIEDFDPSNLYLVANPFTFYADKPRDFLELGL